GTVVESGGAQVVIEAVHFDPVSGPWGPHPLPARLGRRVVGHPTDESAEMCPRRISVVDADDLERNAIRCPWSERDANPAALMKHQSFLVHDVLERKLRPPQIGTTSRQDRLDRRGCRKHRRSSEAMVGEVRALFQVEGGLESDLTVR